MITLKLATWVRVTLLLVLLVVTQSNHANDQYLIVTTNGVGTSPAGAYANMIRTEELIGSEYRGKRVLYTLARNPTDGYVYDVLIESAIQFIDEQLDTTNNEQIDSLSELLSWSDLFRGYFYAPDVAIATMRGAFSARALIESTIKEQVLLYKNFIGTGGGVLIVPHSQGNYYANEAYSRVLNELRTTPDIEKRIGTFHVATPTGHVSGFDIPINAAGQGQYLDRYLTNDEDIISIVPNSLASNTTIVEKYRSNKSELREALWNVLPDNIVNLRALWAHEYSTYLDQSLTLSDEFKAGVYASLDRLEGLEFREWFLIEMSASLQSIALDEFGTRIENMPSCIAIAPAGVCTPSFGGTFNTNALRNINPDDPDSVVCVRVRAESVRYDSAVIDRKISVDNPFSVFEDVPLAITGTQVRGCSGAAAVAENVEIVVDKYKVISTPVQ